MLLSLFEIQSNPCLRLPTNKDHYCKTCLQRPSILSHIKPFSVISNLLTETTCKQRLDFAVPMGGLYIQLWLYSKLVTIKSIFRMSWVIWT